MRIVRIFNFILVKAVKNEHNTICRTRADRGDVPVPEPVPERYPDQLPVHPALFGGGCRHQQAAAQLRS